MHAHSSGERFQLVSQESLSEVNKNKSNNRSSSNVFNIKQLAASQSAALTQRVVVHLITLNS